MPMKKLCIIVLSLSFCLSTLAFSETPLDNATLIPQTQLTNVLTAQKYNLFCQSLYAYKKEAMGRSSFREVEESFLGGAGFDVDIVMDFEGILKKGWTRFYPFKVKGETLFVRVFLTKERSYQEDVEVLAEAQFDKGTITLQIIPSVKTILKAKPIK